MLRKLWLILALGLLAGLLAGCGGGTDAAGQAAEAYLKALVAQDKDQISALSCADWVESAQMEVASFQAVTPRLEDLACAQSGTDGETALVSCQGKIFATYGNEEAEFDLSARTLQMVEEGGDWRMCGYR